MAPADDPEPSEGGRRRTERARRRAHEWPTVAVLLVAAAGLAVVALVSFRRGAEILGAAAIFAGLLRGLLPEKDAGLLAVRSRGFDVLLLTCLGLATIVVAVVVPPPPSP